MIETTARWYQEDKETFNLREDKFEINTEIAFLETEDDLIAFYVWDTQQMPQSRGFECIKIYKDFEEAVREVSKIFGVDPIVHFTDGKEVHYDV